MTHPAPTAALRRLTRRDLALGWVGGAMILGAVALLLAGGPSDGAGTGAPAAAPALHIVSPAGGAAVPARVPLRFRVEGASLTRKPTGWGTEELHLHAAVDGRELMPAPTDVARTAEGDYVWTLGPLGAGERTLRLFWAGPDHRPLVEGGSAPLRVRVE